MGLTNNATVQAQTENHLQKEDEWILLDDVSSEKSEKNDIQSSEEKLDKLMDDIDLLWDICVENKEKLGKTEGKIYESIASEVSSLPSDFLPDTPQIDFQIPDSTAHSFASPLRINIQLKVTNIHSQSRTDKLARINSHPSVNWQLANWRTDNWRYQLAGDNSQLVSYHKSRAELHCMQVISLIVGWLHYKQGEFP